MPYATTVVEQRHQIEQLGAAMESRQAELDELSEQLARANDGARRAAEQMTALQRLETMPDDALSRIDSLMDRAIWERWMQIMPVGSQLATVDDG